MLNNIIISVRFVYTKHTKLRWRVESSINYAPNFAIKNLNERNRSESSLMKIRFRESLLASNIYVAGGKRKIRLLGASVEFEERIKVGIFFLDR